MRKSEYYGVNVPELGDRADITVVSQAIIDSENNQSGKVENMKATVSGTIISLTSETRQDALLKYYNGLAIQFISPVDASAGSSYKIKIGSLTEQPYNNKVDIKVGDIVQAIYGSTGFISANTPIPRSSSVSSNSKTTVATSIAVKQAYDKGKEGLDKANTKLDAGAVSVDYNTGKKIEDKIKEKLDKTAVINDLTTGGADKALSAEMGKKIKQNTDDKVDKADIVDNLTTADKSKVLSANMGKYLSENKVDYVNLRYSSTNSHYVKLCRIKNNKSTSYFPVSRVGLLLTGMNDYGFHGGNVPLMYFSCGVRGNDLDKPLNNKVIKCILLSDTEMERSDGEVYFVAKKDDNNEYIDFYIKLGRYNTNGLCISKVNTSYKYDSVETTFPNEILDYNTYKSKIESGNYVKVYPYRVVETINGSAGITSIIYIQDAGEKTAGNGYVDKTTGQLYLCKTTNSDTSVTSNFVLATNIEIAKRQHFTKTILFDKPTGHGSGDITLSDNWENYDEFLVYGSSDNTDYVGSHRFKKEDIEYSISKNKRYMIFGEANDYWLAKITTGSKTWASGDKWENCAIFRIIGIKYGG